VFLPNVKSNNPPLTTSIISQIQMQIFLNTLVFLKFSMKLFTMLLKETGYEDEKCSGARTDIKVSTFWFIIKYC
jgi:hypothetical protein